MFGHVVGKTTSLLYSLAKSETLPFFPTQKVSHMTIEYSYYKRVAQGFGLIFLKSSKIMGTQSWPDWQNDRCNWVKEKSK